MRTSIRRSARRTAVIDSARPLRAHSAVRSGELSVRPSAANFSLPEPCAWLDAVTYGELGEAAARAVVDAGRRAAAAAGAGREKRARSPPAPGPPAKRARAATERRERRRDLSTERREPRGTALII